MQVDENRVASNRIVSEPTTVYLNGFTSIVTGNIVEDPASVELCSMIVENTNSANRRNVVANNITRNLIHGASSCGPFVRQPNVF